ncbi:MAG: glycosyltransferase family 4 protein [Terriglobales bacterium]
MLILSHPIGNANVRQAVRALNDVGLLREFWTSLAWHPEYLLARILPRSLSRELRRRTFSHVHPDQVHCYPWLEAGRIVANRFRLQGLTRHEVGLFSVDAVYRGLDAAVASRLQRAKNVDAIYAYEDGALASFRVARKLGLKTIYELPIGYWRCYQELMEEEAALQPEWASTLPGIFDSAGKRDRKDEELALSTHIVVASEFVRRTLVKAGPLNALISVAPYGAPATGSVKRRPSGSDGPLKVIFVGMLTQRKGISYLLRAAELLGPNIQLTLVGRRVGKCRALDTALRAHRWIPSLRHADLLQEIGHHDVMVFPSLFEGCALVLLEALSQGVPVITTSHTGASDFLSDGEDGFIVPIRDAMAVAEKLELLAGDRELLAAMSQAATRKAAQRSWEQYRNHLTTVVQQALAGDSAAQALDHSFSAPSEQAC